MSTVDPLHDLELLIKSRYGVILLETPEVDRATSLLRHVADRLGIAFFRWTRSTGLSRDAGEASVYGTLEPSAALAHVASASLEALYHFEDLGDIFEDRQIVATLKDAGREAAQNRGAVVLSGEGLSPPRSLSGISVSMQLPGPDAAEFRELIRDIIRDVKKRRRIKVELTPEDLDHLLANLRGLTLMEAEKVLTKAIVEDGLLDAADISAIAEHKKSIVEREGLLEYYPVREGLEEVADLEALKSWLEKRRRLLTEPERAREYGLDFPRGILLLGVPGCGKSLCAKAVASSWRLPLLKLDPSGLYSKYMGESEANFKRAMRTAVNMAPIVLWIDELEKAFSSSAGDQDGGTSKRVFGTFLSWLQDREGDVFIVATANDVQKLPPELLRKGRFDEIFFVDLPTGDVREHILRIHLRRRKQEPEVFDLSALSEAMQGFTGSEIEQAVVSALYTAFAAGTPLRQEHLEAEIGSTRPLSVTLREKIDALREWAQERTRSAH